MSHLSNPNVDSYIPLPIGDIEEPNVEIVVLTLSANIKRKILEKISTVPLRPSIILLDIHVITKGLSDQDKIKVLEKYNGRKLIRLFGCDLYTVECKPEIIVMGE